MGSLFESGAENILLSGSFDQARYVWRACREFLGEDGYSYLDSTNKIGDQAQGNRTRAWYGADLLGLKGRLGS